MTTAPETAAIPDEAASDAANPAPDATEELHTTLLGAVEEWLLSMRTAFARAIDIGVLEARLAALNFTLIVIVAVASGLLLATAWIALFAALVAWLHELGLTWSAALLLVAATNCGLAALGGYAIYRMSNNLLFKAVRKFITYGQHETIGLKESTNQSDKMGERDAAAGSAAGNAPPAP